MHACGTTQPPARPATTLTASRRARRVAARSQGIAGHAPLRHGTTPHGHKTVKRRRANARLSPRVAHRHCEEPVKMRHARDREATAGYGRPAYGIELLYLTGLIFTGTPS
jgi:hypothetical protein